MPRVEAVPGLENSAASKMQQMGHPLFNYYFKRDPLTGQMNLDPDSVPTAELFDYFKRGLDDKIGGAYRSGAADDARIWTGIKNDLVDAVDKQTNTWKQARDTWGSFEGVNNAVEAGQALFSRGTRVDQFRADLQNMSKPELEAMLQGARDASAETMDSTYRGQTRSLDQFQAPANQQKLQMLLQKVYGTDQGNQRFNDLVTSVNRERDFANSRSTTIFNSETNRRQEYSKTLSPPEGFIAKLVHAYSPEVQPGQLLKFTGIPQRAQAGAEARYEQMRGSLGDMLTQQGPQAADIASALLRYNPPSRTINPTIQH
jgi:hypothetical protein